YGPNSSPSDLTTCLHSDLVTNQSQDLDHGPRDSIETCSSPRSHLRVWVQDRDFESCSRYQTL
uniref:Uncharacterized protein n=1 Tax=Cannabis sativa TaxID=3483 RepID=A0A803QDH3_CANSA